jgi:integrase
VKRKAPSIYTPEEFNIFLIQCAQKADKKIGRHDYSNFIPAVAIAAFAGLRWAEILSLDWSQIHWEDRVIEVGEENKTGYRLVPIQPNLMTLLAPYRESFGPVCPHRRPHHVVARIRERAGLPSAGRRYANAFRHSFVTYRVAVTKNMPQVSGESGHSVPELRRSYNRASLESAGLKWFSIGLDAANVLQMPLMSMRGQKAR